MVGVTVLLYRRYIFFLATPLRLNQLSVTEIRVYIAAPRTARGRMALAYLLLCLFTWLALRLLLFRKSSSAVKTMAVLGSGAVSANPCANTSP